MSEHERDEPRKLSRRWRVLMYVAVALVLWQLAGCFLHRAALFPTWMMPGAPVAEKPPDADVLTLDTDQGQVEAWFIPGQGVSDQNPGPMVIFAHGNGELIDYWPGSLGQYTQRGVSVLLPEYRGYGRSAGSPSQKRIVGDFVAFYDMAAARSDVDADRIVFHGRSLGGGILAQLARHRPAAATVLESVFVNTTSFAKRYLLLPMMVRDPLPVQSVLREYDKPVLILHGTRDSIIKPWHAERNHAAAPDSRLVWLEMGHNDPPPHEQYWPPIVRFLDETGIVDPGATRR